MDSSRCAEHQIFFMGWKNRNYSNQTITQLHSEVRKIIGKPEEILNETDTLAASTHPEERTLTGWKRTTIPGASTNSGMRKQGLGEPITTIMWSRNATDGLRESRKEKMESVEFQVVYRRVASVLYRQYLRKKQGMKRRPKKVKNTGS